MINEKQVKKFCKDYTKIENYEDAVNDTTQTWHCHHILGEILTRQQLKDHDFYYNVPPCMLKFVTSAEHRRLHMKNMSEEHRRKLSEAKKGKKFSEETRRKISEANKRRTLSEETRRKISESMKGENHPFYGKQHTYETKKKMSEAHKGENNQNFGKHISDDMRRKISEALKGRTFSEEHRRKLSEAHKRKKF